jgi:hypothetical protein
MAALLTVKIKKPTSHTVARTVGVVAGLETLLFGFVWMALVFQVFVSP